MRDYCTDLTFNASGNQCGKGSLESTLALVNNTSYPDKTVNEDAAKFLRAYNIDFHSENKDAPRELPALYEDIDDGRMQLTIFSPRYGHIKDVTKNLDAPKKLRESITPRGRYNDWMYFSSAQTNYVVDIQ